MTSAACRPLRMQLTLASAPAPYISQVIRLLLRVPLRNVFKSAFARRPRSVAGAGHLTPRNVYVFPSSSTCSPVKARQIRGALSRAGAAGSKAKPAVAIKQRTRQAAQRRMTCDMRQAYQKDASGRKSKGIVSRPSRIRSAMTCPTLGAMPNPILKPPLAMN